MLLQRSILKAGSFHKYKCMQSGPKSWFQKFQFSRLMNRESEFCYAAYLLAGAKINKLWGVNFHKWAPTCKNHGINYK